MRQLPTGMCWWCGAALAEVSRARRYCCRRCRQAGFRARRRPPPTADQLGADGIVSRQSAYEGGQHYTAYKADGGQISWDFDAAGNLIPGTYHLSDRNVAGPGAHSSWDEHGYKDA
jgi:hypothetical protein